jgi:hypothetical protein
MIPNYLYGKKYLAEIVAAVRHVSKRETLKTPYLKAFPVLSVFRLMWPIHHSSTCSNEELQ